MVGLKPWEVWDVRVCDLLLMVEAMTDQHTDTSRPKAPTVEEARRIMARMNEKSDG